MAALGAAETEKSMSNSENQAKLHVVIGGGNHSLSKHKRKANLKSKANTVERQRDEVKTELIAAFAKVLEALRRNQADGWAHFQAIEAGEGDTSTQELQLGGCVRLIIPEIKDHEKKVNDALKWDYDAFIQFAMCTEEAAFITGLLAGMVHMRASDEELKRVCESLLRRFVR